MISRFLAISSCSRSIPQQIVDNVRSTTSLRSSFISPCLHLMTGPDSTVLDLAGSGQIFGTVFRRGEVFPASLRDGETKGIVASRGASLITEFWGAYVAFILDGDGVVSVLRDPSAAQPCYFTRAGDLLVLASDLPTLFATGIAAPAIDWREMDLHLRTFGRWGWRTCLVGVDELPRGWRMQLRGSIQSDRLWSPWAFADRPLRQTPHEAAEGLRTSLIATVKGWSNCIDHTVLKLSGGLDSSILAASLSEAGASFECATFATEESVGDERRYARAVCEQLDVSLTELRYDSDAYDPEQPIFPHISRPIGNANAMAGQSVVRAFAASVEGNAVWDGGIGDSLFCSLRSSRVLADRIRAGQFGGGAWRTLQDLSQLTGCSYSEIARLALSHVRRPAQPARWRAPAHFLTMRSDDFLDDMSWYVWSGNTKRLSPGKAAHVASVYQMHNYVENVAGGEGPTAFSPLTSQPLLEACFAIPTWYWCLDGRDRAIARMAFAGRLPQSVLDRKGKGGPDSVQRGFFAKNELRMAEFLATGLLVENGIVDGEQILALRSASPARRDALANAFLSLVNAEAWARYWTCWRAPTVDRSQATRHLDRAPIEYSI